MHTYVLFLFLCICSITCGDYLPNYNKIGTRPNGMQRPTDYPQPSVAAKYQIINVANKNGVSCKFRDRDIICQLKTDCRKLTGEYLPYDAELVNNIGSTVLHQNLFVQDDGDRLPNTGLRGSRPNQNRRTYRLPPYAKIGTLPRPSFFLTGTIAPVYPETINSEILKLILSAGSDMLGK